MSITAPDRPPWISVVLPTRDRPRLVAGAAASVLAQEGARVELCVVDDGSREPPPLPADPRLALLRLPRPGGAAAARNAGLAATDGELVAFLDDDDAWLAGKLARQVAALQAAGPAAVAVACGFELWDGARLVASVLPPADVNDGGLLAHPCLWPSTVLVRRSALEAAGGFDASLSRTEDWDLWLRLSDLGTIATLGEVLVDRRWSPLAPATARSARAAMVPRLEARLERLPPGQAAGLRARRHADDGVLLARLGRRRAAARVLAGAWWTAPASRPAALGLARVLAGERAWALATRALAGPRARRALRRRAPRPPGPAPAWAAP